MSRPECALLFAAGFGTRMAPLTDTMPKPLVIVAGKPLFDHALDVVRGGGIRRVVANTHYKAAKMSRHLAARGVEESFEPEILETGGGLKAALPFLREPASVTLNTDAVWTGKNPVRALLNAWDPERMDCLMMLIPPDRATGHAGQGDFAMDADGRLTFAPGLVYSGVQIIKTAPFAEVPEPAFRMHRVWTDMLAARRVFGAVHDGGWCDVGQPDSIALAERLLEDADV